MKSDPLVEEACSVSPPSFLEMDRSDETTIFETRVSALENVGLSSGSPDRTKAALSARSFPWVTTVVLAFALIAAAPSGYAAPTDPAEIDKQLKIIVDSERFQTELPKPDPPEPKKEKKPSTGTGLGDVAYYLLIGVVAVGALFILYTLATQKIALTRRGAAPGRLRQAQQKVETAPSAEELANAEAEALAEAKAGRFEEAIHILLLGAIGRLREKNARAAARSLTSREILSRVANGPEGKEAKAALRALVAAVEISRFGGQPLDQAAFDRCLEAYRALRTAVGGEKSKTKVPRVRAEGAA